jgi:hypothetical protein
MAKGHVFILAPCEYRSAIFYYILLFSENDEQPVGMRGRGGGWAGGDPWGSFDC